MKLRADRLHNLGRGIKDKAYGEKIYFTINYIL